MSVTLNRVTHTDRRPDYHATIYDDFTATIAGVLLCDPEGEVFTDGEKQFPIAVFPLEQRGIQTFNTVSDLDSRAYPYMTIAQQDFSGGRGGIWFDDDKSKIRDGYNADTVSSDFGVMPQLQPTLTRGGIVTPTGGGATEFTYDKFGKYYKAHQPRFGTGNGASVASNYHAKLSTGASGGQAYHAIRFQASATYQPTGVYFYVSRNLLNSYPSGTAGQITVGIAPEVSGAPDLTGVSWTTLSPHLNTDPVYDTNLPPDVPQMVGYTGAAGTFGTITSGSYYYLVIYSTNTSATNFWILPTMWGSTLGEFPAWYKLSNNGTSWGDGQNSPWIAVRRYIGEDTSVNWGRFFNHRGGMYYIGAGASSGYQLMQNGDRGRITAYATGVITDSSKSWTTDVWKGSYLQILPNSYSGNHNAPHRSFFRIESNTSTTITLEQYHDVPVGAEYVIIGGIAWVDRSPGTMTVPDGNFVSSIAQSERYTWFAGGEGTKKVWGYGDWINASGSVETFQRELAGLHASHIATVWDEGVGDWALYGANHSSNAEVLKNNIWKVHVPRYKMIGYTATTNVYPIHKEAKIIQEDDLYNDGVAGQHANVTYNVLANDVTPSAIKSTNDANHHHFQLNTSHGANVIAWRNLSQSTDFSPFDMMSYDIQVDQAVASGQLAFCVSDVEDLGFGVRRPTWTGIQVHDAGSGIIDPPTYTAWYNATDGGTTKTSKTGTWNSNNAILICSDEPFNKITISVGSTVNTVASPLWIGYWDKSNNRWTSFGSVTDTTESPAGTPLGQSGDITYTAPGGGR